MNYLQRFLLIVLACSLAAGCGERNHEHGSAHEHEEEAELPRGPHGGRLLEDGAFAIELAIFESGVPPEYHAWPTLEDKPVPLDEVDLTVELTRLGNKVDRFKFIPQGDYLRGDGVVREPHSFVVNVTATYAGQTHTWSYDSFEGRTQIATDIAQAAEISTETVGPATLVETITAYGRIAPDPTRLREVTARFPGIIKQVHKKVGDHVRAGEPLASVESNESLRTYTVSAPIAGLVTSRDANAGEQSRDRMLFTIIDSSSVSAELSLFPAHRARVSVGTPVSVKAAHSEAIAMGRVDRIEMHAAENQTVQARVTIDNSEGQFLPGSFVTAEIEIGKREVPLAVKTEALQPFRDFTVVFEQVGDTYEVRMLEVGQTAGEWAEVLGGIEAGAQYVTKNSYLLKADVEKSGASHDH